MKRYKVQLTDQSFFVLAKDDHDASQQGANLADKYDSHLHDVSLDNPEEDTDDLEGESLLWL